MSGLASTLCVMHLSDSDSDSDSLCIMHAHLRARVCVSFMLEWAYSLAKVTPTSCTVCAREVGSSKHSHFRSFHYHHQLLVTSLP